MTDSSFLMQRYWGSDDSDAADNTLQKQSPIISVKKKKKKDKTSDVVETVSSPVGDEQDSTIVESNTLSPLKKKLKKRKRKSERDSDVSHNEEELFKHSRQLNTQNETKDNGLTSKIKSKNIIDSVQEIKNSEVSSSKKRKRKVKQEMRTDIEATIPFTVVEEGKCQVDDLQQSTHEMEIKQDTDSVASKQNKTVKDKKRKLKKINVKEVLDSTEGARTSYTVLGEVKNQRDTPLQRELPEWLAKPTIISVNLNDQRQPVSELTYLDDVSKSNLLSEGIKHLFPVQQAVVPWVMECDHRRLSVHPPDLCVSAPTGSGKTLAFVLPIVQSLRSRVVCQTRVLAVLPVGDLAIQVFRVFQTFCKSSDLKTVFLSGKKSFHQEQLSLVQPGTRGHRCLADIVVTTPGRLLDHIRKTPGFTLKHLRYLVIDEADRMMEEIQQGWLRQVELAIFGDSPNRVCPPQYAKGISLSSASAFGHVAEPLQKLLLSATLSQDPETLHSLSLYRPKLFSAQNAVNPDTLQELCVMCDAPTKPMVILHLIQERGFKQVLCFVDKVERAHRLSLILDAMGDLKVREVSSNSSPVQRKIVLSQFASGKIDILVCSDMVARGMDLEGVDCVLSYDAPIYPKTYVHRCGRTARAGRSGTAITLLADGEELQHFKKMLRRAHVKYPKCISISNEVLKPYVGSYESALSKANVAIERKNRKDYLQKACFKT